MQYGAKAVIYTTHNDATNKHVGPDV